MQSAIKHRVLAYLLRDVEYVHRALQAGVTLEYFQDISIVGDSPVAADSQESQLFEAILWYYQTYRQVLSRQVFMDELARYKVDSVRRQQFDNLFHLIAQIEVVSGDFDYCINKLRDFYVTIKMNAALQQASLSLQKGEPWNALHDLQRTIVQLVTTRGDREKTISLKEWSKTALQEYMESLNPENQQSSGIRLGLPGLDDVIMGIRPPYLTIFVSRTNNGKSMALLNSGLHMLLKQGLNVLFATREMSAQQQLERIVPHVSCGRFSINDYVARNIPETGIDAFAQGMNRIQQAPGDMFIVPPSACTTVADLEVELRAVLENHRVDAICADYLNEFYPSNGIRRGGDSQDYISQAAIAQEMKDLSIRYNIPVFTASQDNREAAGSKAATTGTETIALSDFIGARADLVIRLYRTPHHEQNRQVVARIIKSRHTKKVDDIILPELFEYAILGYVPEDVIPLVQQPRHTHYFQRV